MYKEIRVSGEEMCQIEEWNLCYRRNNNPAFPRTPAPEPPLPPSNPSIGHKSKGVEAPASRKRSTPTPTHKSASAPPVSSTNKRRSASDDTPSTDKGIFGVGTKLRRRFHLSDFENTILNLFEVTHIWLDGEVTKIRYVNYRTQYTCAFKEGKRSKVVNEYDAENIEQ